jgi:hypothetical protein
VAIQSYASHSFRAHAFRARSLASIPAGPQPFALVLARVTPRVFSCLFATQSAGASTASRTLSARVTHREFAPPEYPIQ